MAKKKQLKSSTNHNALLRELARRKNKQEEIDETPEFKLEEFCFDKQLEFIQDTSQFATAVCSRRSGKCRPKNTLVKTPTGSVNIQDLRPGDVVYGYDSDGVVRPCNVTHIWDQGVKDVVDLIWNRQIIATSTMDHKWLAHNTYKDERKVKQLKDFNVRDKIAEEYVPIPGGNKHVEEAYAIGALLGDGCSRESGIVISGQDEEVIYKTGKLINATVRKNSQYNHSWQLKGLKKTDPQLYFYNKWCRDRYAHEKICDLNEIRTWTRKSQIEFLSGLIDTDGSIYLTNDGRISIRLSMQAEIVIETAQMLILDLFQYKPQRSIDDRDKYKNGPVHEIRICNNKYSKRILRELTTVTPRKQWKPEYENMNERNTNPNFVGFKLSEPRKEHCYDITVDNDTHLFLDANGLIGHNSVGCAADLISTCMGKADITCLYITLSRKNAKRIIWREIKKILKDFSIDHTPDNSDLSIEFPNGSILYVSGAKDAQEIEKFRGLALYKVYIDECQSFREYIRELVEDVIEPALFDYNGYLRLIGTPGPVCGGYYYDACHNDEWSQHKWTIFDNPHIERKSGMKVTDILAQQRKRRGVTEQDPSYRRESLGEWVHDENALVYRYNALKNNFLGLPVDHKWNFIFGIDIGWDDSDAIAVLAYSLTNEHVYLVEEMVENKLTITDLVDRIMVLKDKYDPIKMVMDAGALGKKIQEEILQRHQLYIEAAEKHRKLEFIELLNDDLRTGKLKIRSDSRAAEDYNLIQWDMDKSTNGKRVVSDTYHSDISDAVLYAWREARHYAWSEKVVPPKRGTNEYMEMMEQKLAEKMEREASGNDFEALYDINESAWWEK